MGLKLRGQAVSEGCQIGLNRTSVGLKQDALKSHDYRFEGSLNRTSVGLKPLARALGAR